MAKHITLLILLFPSWIIAQNLELLTELHDQIDESSGLIYLDGRLITHNDSEGVASLYEIDSLTGNVIREVAILNATNHDWEDVCYDAEYIYIGDFGNNNGSRTDLKIYRIPRTDYLNTTNNAVHAEVISFHYGDQTNFTSTPLNTEYDAEAVISLGDSLYIFTKNWIHLTTSVYPIPKIPGEYELIKIDSLDSDGLITGADISQETGRILLSGYNGLQPFVVSIAEYANNSFSQGTVQKTNIDAPSGYSFQIEGIAVIAHDLFYLTSEENFLGNAGLYKLNFNTSALMESESEEISLYPNPASDSFQVLTSQNVVVHIYNAVGKKVKTTLSKRVNVSELPTGSYIVEICGSKGQILSNQKLLIQR